LEFCARRMAVDLDTDHGRGDGQAFLGVGFSKIAFSTLNPNLAVAATAGDNGLYVGLEEDGNSTARGLYFSKDGGVTWNRAILSDGAVPASATAVIYNASQGRPGLSMLHSAARAVFFDGWAALHAAGGATDGGANIGELSGGFEFADVLDLSRRVCGGAGTR